MLKDTKSLGNKKAPACESRGGFIHSSNPYNRLNTIILSHISPIFYLT